jgi:hypothetical protein
VTTGTDLPRPAVTDRFAPIGPMGRVRATVADAPARTALATVLEAAPDLKRDIVATGRVAGVTTGDLTTFAYPTAIAFRGAARSPAPLLWLTARFLVVQWEEPVRRRGRVGATRRRTLLWGAVDGSDGTTTPVPSRARAALPGRLLIRSHGSVAGHLRALGIDPAQVDLVGSDHLQGRDLRRALGTTRPAPDLGAPDAPLTGRFPNARLVTSRREWASLAGLHPLQAPWYRPGTFADLDPDRVLLTDGDVTLGPGVALVENPGHTAGTQSLVLHTDDGVWTSSTNAVAAECYVPRASRIPGLRSHAVTWGHEVIPNANTPERLGDHHDAMLLERALADPAADAPVPRCFPLAELTASRLAPALAPTAVHGGIESGTVRGGPVEGGSRAA